MEMEENGGRDTLSIFLANKSAFEDLLFPFYLNTHQVNYREKYRYLTDGLLKLQELKLY